MNNKTNKDGLRPIAPVDVEMRMQSTGEIIAWDKANGLMLASGFYSREDFEQWMKSYFGQMKI